MRETTTITFGAPKKAPFDSLALIVNVTKNKDKNAENKFLYACSVVSSGEKPHPATEDFFNLLATLLSVDEETGQPGVNIKDMRKVIRKVSKKLDKDLDELQAAYVAETDERLKTIEVVKDGKKVKENRLRKAELKRLNALNDTINKGD